MSGPVTPSDFEETLFEKHSEDYKHEVDNNGGRGPEIAEVSCCQGHNH